MNIEMKRIGEMLRKKREEMDLSLKEAENATSIRLEYLQAIEEGRIHEFISGIYASGFTKQYVSFLGFNVEQIVQENPGAFNFQSKPHDFPYGIGTLEMRGSLGGGVKWLPNILWAAGATIAIILAYYFSKAVGLF